MTKQYINSKVYLPKNNYYSEILRFLVQKSPPDSPDLNFLVSLWSFAISRDGLTDKQEECFIPYIRYYEKIISESEILDG